MKQNMFTHVLVRGLHLLVIAAMLAGLALNVLPVPVAHAATITVNTTDDEDNTDGDCSLREAIYAANNDTSRDACTAGSGDDTIIFNIPGTDPGCNAAGVCTIQPSSPLPVITDTVTINGYSQTGALPATATTDAVLKIVLDGINAGAAANGLVIQAGNTTVRGLVIHGFDGNGIVIQGGTGNTIAGNFIGTDVTGTAAIPNRADGINITDAMTNTIGGTTPEARSLVSGNGGHGISIVNDPKTWDPNLEVFQGTGEASGNIIQGNYIGTNVSGTAPLSNTLNGVLITDASNNVVKGNLVSGNGENGIAILNTGAPGNVETDVVTAEGPGPVSGSGSAMVTITDQPDAIEVTKTADPTSVAAAGDVVTFTVRITNTHGANVTIKRLSDSVHANLNGVGTCLVPQSLVNGASYTCSFSAAVFGADGNSETDTVTASGTDINGNFIIDSASATVNIGEAPSIAVSKTANPTTLAPPGGTVNFTAAVKNISTGNVTINKMWDTKHGKLIPNGLCAPISEVSLNPGDTLQCTYSATVSGATGNTVEGNFIGTDSTGTISVPNQLAGIQITDAPDNAIGASGNLISGNAREGVVLLGAGATGNSLQHNLIGTQADGTSDLGNGSHGVFVAADASDNAIGLSAGASNTIAYNGGDGVFVLSGTGNQILSNSIFDNDELGIELGDDNAVTPNDDTDPDAGANNLQNFPVLTSASSTTTGGVLDSTPSTTFTIQFFSSPTLVGCDPSGFGEGQTFLGQASLPTDGSGHVFFAVGLSLPSGNLVTATVTDPYGNTSEFSNCIPVPSAPVLSINKEVQDLNGGSAEPGDTLLYTINYSNTGYAPATGVFIEDTYSVSCTIISNITNDGFPDHNDNGTRLLWPATGGILLDAQASGSVSYRCTLDDSFPDGTTNVINTSTIDSAQTTPEQDTETVPVTAAPVLTINKQVQNLNGGSAEPGDTLRYTIHYTNTGNAPSTGVFITDDYSDLCATISNVTTDGNFLTFSDTAGVLRWPQDPNATTLAAGASGSLCYDCTLQATFPPGTADVTNTSTINSNETDPEQDMEMVLVTRGIIVVNKQTDPAGGTGFVFTDTIALPNTFTLDDGGTNTFNDVIPDTYTITETDPLVTPGHYNLTNLGCTEDKVDNSTEDLDNRRATINLDPGETITCTFTNIHKGTIVIEKVTNPAGGTGFDFTDDIESPPHSFSLDDGGTQNFVDVEPGAYTVTETVPWGWEIATIVCSDDSPTEVPSGTASIDLAPEEAVACTFTNKALDTDGDGIFDHLEGTGDRDGDGIPDCLDYDPSGYFYDEATGEIIAGGRVSVTGPGAVTIVHDGSSGFYQFTTDGTAGTYTITLTLPPSYVLSRKCLRQDPPPFDPTGGPNPTVLGNGEDGATGFLTSNACTDYYFTFDLELGDPFIINNNFPLKYVPPVPVGGYIVPVNELELLGPWITLVAVVIISTIAVMARKRRDSEGQV